jgi:Fur family transcriptional regulator, ferric uptake regulator
VTAGNSSTHVDDARLPTSGRQRNTRQAAQVESVLAVSEGFRTAQQLHSELQGRGEKVGLTTVYRHLNLLAANGTVDVVHTADGEAQYRMCTPPAGAGRHDHHHHVVCRVCGRSVEVSGPEVEAWAERVAREAGFTEVTHTLEVFGLCQDHSAPATD